MTGDLYAWLVSKHHTWRRDHLDPDTKSRIVRSLGASLLTMFDARVLRCPDMACWDLGCCRKECAR
jgi:hypothetical protein